jgi:hypothetical protein
VNPASAGSCSERDEVRVSTLELFFDLVFVFTITQLTSVLAQHPTGQGLLRFALMLVVIGWMYGGYAWLTNVVAPDRFAYQLLLLSGMAAFLVISLAVRTLSIGKPRWRLAAAALALATVPLGPVVSAVAQLASLFVCVAGCLTLEALTARGAAEAGPVSWTS